MKWILGFIVGILLLVIGNAVVLFAAQLLFTYLPYWLASVLGVIATLFGAYKTVDMSFYVIPYKLIGVTNISLYRVFRAFIIITALLCFFNHDFFNDFPYMPKWLYIVQQIFYIGGVWSLSEEIKLYLFIKNDTHI